MAYVGSNFERYTSDETDSKAIGDDITEQIRDRKLLTVEEFAQDKSGILERLDLQKEDIPKILERLTIWTELIQKETGIPVDTVELIKQHADYKNTYNPTMARVVFSSSEVLAGKKDKATILILPTAEDFTPKALSFHSEDIIRGQQTNLGFLGLSRINDITKINESDKQQNISIAMPNEMLKWMPEKALEMLANEAQEASHDFVHSAMLFFPPGEKNQAMEDLQMIWSMSEQASPGVANLEAHAIMTRKAIQETLFDRHPDLKGEAIQQVANYLAVIEAHRQQSIEDDPTEAEKYNNWAEVASILYLTHLRPGITLDDIPDIEQWKDDVKATTRQLYKDVEQLKTLPWAGGQAKPEEITALFAVSLADMLAELKEEQKLSGEEATRPIYGGPLFPGPRFDYLPFSVEQSQELLKKLAPSFLGNPAGDVMDDFSTMQTEEGYLTKLEKAGQESPSLAEAVDDVALLLQSINVNRNEKNNVWGDGIAIMKDYDGVLTNLKQEITKFDGDLESRNEIKHSIDKALEMMKKMEQTFRTEEGELLEETCKRMEERVTKAGFHLNSDWSMARSQTDEVKEAMAWSKKHRKAESIEQLVRKVEKSILER